MFKKRNKSKLFKRRLNKKEPPQKKTLKLFENQQNTAKNNAITKNKKSLNFRLDFLL